jgi:hypothetical protein
MFMSRREVTTAALVLTALLLLGGCANFGCGAAAANGAAVGGCHAGTRF